MYYEYKTREIKSDKNTNYYENEDFKVYWEGFVFISGIAPGEPSIERLLDSLKNDQNNGVYEQLSGVYACFIRDIKKDTVSLFSDNIGLKNLFNSENYVCTSLLDSIRLNGLTKADINQAAITDFIATTSCMGWKTFFEEIKKTKYNQIIFDDGKEIQFREKNLTDIFALRNIERSIIERFEGIANSLKQFTGKISQDLSGGLDTRLIATLLKHYDVEFETAISGMPGNGDVKISKDVAEVLETEHYVTYHDVKSNTIEKELDEAFINYDACQDIVIWHRGYKFQKDKVNRNCKLTMTGHAGELYKPEFIWNMQNNDPKATINRLVSLNNYIRYGMKFNTIPHEIFTESYQRQSKSYKSRLTDYLFKTYGKDNSGMTGPKIYVYFQEGSRTTNMGPLINRYSPLLDRRIIPCGITLKTGKSSFREGIKITLTQPWNHRSTFQRKVITHLNPDVAKVRTTYTMGSSISTKPYEVIKRVGKYYYKKSKDMIIKSKPTPPISSLNPDLYPTIRSLSSTEDLLDILKSENILKSEIQVDDINNTYFGSVFTIGKLIKYCENLS